MNMNGKPVAIVTGGGTGIGAACCRALAADGFCVGVHYRSSISPAMQLLEEMGDGFLLHADLADPEQVEAMVQKIKEIAGKVDVLVNNAGVSINAPIHGMKLDQFDAQRSLMRGIWYFTKRVIRLFMLRGGGGRIVNVSSVVGSTGNAGQIAYCMEKAAMDAFTRSLAKECSGRNILVNSVAPGFIETDMTAGLPEEIRAKILADIPLERMGRPEEVAEVVSFLSRRGSYVTGSVIHVNGGLYGG
ncbi:MAG: 3-oxoacyl-ACP reductase FabG [Syntrophaceae bacterium]|nr:3-oxoacyl-ACP reductase FabG [Syntrophaceae bacterium]